MSPTKIIKDAFNRGVRHIRHSKGFGVHSPFAYSIIREVIEERCAYYAYLSMQRAYPKGSPVSFKVACLLFRLANRFQAREILEVNFDGGFSRLPLTLVDSRNRVTSIGKDCSSLADLPEGYCADMIVLSAIPEGFSAETLYAWLRTHSHPNTLFWLYNIRPKRPLTELWDRFCDDDQHEITMDLYDYGIAIRRPHFFKQHYIVSF